jgi:hypothetical protein
MAWVRTLRTGARIYSSIFAVSVTLALLLLSSSALALDYAPMCDPAGSTVAMPGPAPDAHSGEIDTWLCSDRLTQHLSESGPRVGEGIPSSDSKPLPSFPSPELAMPASWALPVRPFVSQVPFLCVERDPARAPDADGLYRPPRIRP